MTVLYDVDVIAHRAAHPALGDALLAATEARLTDAVISEDLEAGTVRVACSVAATDAEQALRGQLTS